MTALPTHRRNEAVPHYLYNQNDQLIREFISYGYNKESNSGAGTSYSYDSRGNRIRVVNGFGQTVEERVYNLQNSVSAYRDGYGNQTDFAYILDGQVKEVRREQGRRNAAEKGSEKENKVLQSYEYNARGQIIGLTDGNGEKAEYSLDSWGRITGIGFSDGVTEDYEYTPAGQVSKAVDGNGNAVQYRYNSLGKVCERTDQSGYKETFQYDEEGNLSLHTDRDGRQIARTYNVFGSLVYEKATDENGQLKEKRSSGKRLVSYTYDKTGQIAELTDPAGVTTCYEYDILGRTSRIYSREGMEVKYAYNCLDRPERITYGNGLETVYGYDADSRVTHLETRHGDEILLSFRYEYDGNGNRISKTGIQPGIAGTDYATAGSCALDMSYQYDVRGRLLEEKQNEEVFRYAYDAAGNRIKKEDREGITTYCYNEKNQLVSEEGLKGRNTFTYNRQGSILKKESQTGESRFFYNNKNQQIRMELEDGRVQENRYDAEGLRHEMKENGKLLRFVYHNGELLHERYEGGDKEESSYHLGLGIEAIQRNQGICYYHRDEQLSTALMTAQNGEIQNQYRYDAFGNMLESAEELPNRIRYTGQQYDQVTEQYYLRARYYTPVLGRFLQEDVYQGDGLNLYAYCGNNPVVYYDPSGYAETETGCPPQGKLGDGSGEQGVGERVPANSSENISFRDMMTPEEAERYDNYWKQGAGSYENVIAPDGSKKEVIKDGGNINTRQRLQTAPGVESIVDVKYGENGDYMYYRETIFDEYGRKIGTNDYTDHQRPDVPTHTNPHHHTNPSTDPSQHGKPIPGLHPNTP